MTTPVFRYISSSAETDAAVWTRRYTSLRHYSAEQGLDFEKMGAAERGLLQRVVDFVSRPNYAIAGATEEIARRFTGHNPSGLQGVKHVGSRVWAELLGTEDAQRRTFGDVFERAGLPDIKMSELLSIENMPQWMDFGVRGTIALGMDIFTDPSVYVTYPLRGPLGAMKIVGRGGETHFVNAAGKAEFQRNYLKHARGVAKSFGLEDEFIKAAEAGDDSFGAFVAKLDDMTVDRKSDMIAGMRALKRDAVEHMSQTPGEAFRMGRDVADRTLNERLARLAERDVAKMMRAAGPDSPLRAKRAVQFMGRNILNVEPLHEKVVDPQLRAIVKVLESNKGTEYMLNAYRTSSKAVHDLFNVRTKATQKLGLGFSRMLDTMENRNSLAHREISRIAREISRGENTDTPFWHLLTRAIDNPDKHLQPFLKAASVKFGDPEIGADMVRLLSFNMEDVFEREAGERLWTSDLVDLIQQRYKVHSEKLTGTIGWRYIPHISKSPLSADEQQVLGVAVQRWRAQTKRGLPRVTRASLGSFDEMRNFTTLDEWEEFIAESLASADIAPEIKAVIQKSAPLLDPIALYTRRMVVGEEAINMSRFLSRASIMYGTSVGLDQYKMWVKMLGAARGIFPDDITTKKYTEAFVKAAKIINNPGENPFGRVRGTDLPYDDILSGKTPLTEAMLVSSPESPQSLVRTRAQAAFEKLAIGGTEEDLDVAKGVFLMLFKDIRTEGEFNAVVHFGKKLWNGKIVSWDAWNKMRDVMETYGLSSARVGIDGMPLVKTNIAVAGQTVETWLPQGFADVVQSWNQSVFDDQKLRDLLRPFDMVQNTFKRLVTVPYVPFHVRNAYNNVAAMMMHIGVASMHPLRHKEAIEILAGKREGTIVASNGIRYTYGQIRRMLDAHDIRVEFSKIADLIPAAGFRSAPKNKLLREADKALGKVERKAALIEEEARALFFIEELRRGALPHEAARSMKRVLFNYSELTAFQRGFLKRLVPFYTWQDKNIRLQIANLFERPGQLVAQVKPFRDRGPEEDMLPEYMRGDMRVSLGKNAKGGHSFLHGIDLPQQNLDLLFAGSPEATMRKNMSNLSPLIKGWLEIGMDRELFTNRPIKGQQWMGQWGPVLEKIDKVTGGYFEVEKIPFADGRYGYRANGTKVYLAFKSWALSRALGTAADFNAILDGDREGAVGLWKLLSGISLREYDLSDEQEAMLRNRFERLERRLLEKGYLRKVEKSVPTKAQEQEPEQPTLQF